MSTITIDFLFFRIRQFVAYSEVKKNYVLSTLLGNGATQYVTDKL